MIGCGNPARSDDGAGVEVIRRLKARPAAPGVEYIDAGTSGMDVMFRVRGAAHVLIVDACRSGSEPGALFRLPAREAMTATEHGYSLHGMRWDHALYAGHKMFGDAFIDQAEVILIEAQHVAFGLELSAAVQLAVCKVVDLVEGVVASHA